MDNRNKNIQILFLGAAGEFTIVIGVPVTCNTIKHISNKIDVTK